MYVYWEATLLIPATPSGRAHPLLPQYLHSALPEGRASSRADLVFTSYMLWIPLDPNFPLLVDIYVLLSSWFKGDIPLVRAEIYLLDDFFMAVGVSQGSSSTSLTSYMQLSCPGEAAPYWSFTPWRVLLRGKASPPNQIRQLEGRNGHFTLHLATLTLSFPGSPTSSTSWGSLDSVEHRTIS